jgi:hypothetical protein
MVASGTARRATGRMDQDLQDRAPPPGRPRQRGHELESPRLSQAGDPPMAGRQPASAAAPWPSLTTRARQAVPPLLFGLRLSASVCLALYLAFWLQLDAPAWAGTTAAIVCQPQLGASLRKGWFRMLGTIAGAIVAVAITAAFPQDRTGFLVTLTLWGGACAVAATLLRNFAAYAAGLAALTTAVIAADQLGATGGPDGQALMLGITRVTEVCLGIVSAGVVLAATDFGVAQRQLAAALAALVADIAADFAATLRRAGHDLRDTRPARREFVRRVIALDPVIDQAIGESTALRNRSLTLQAAMAGGLAALGGWRAAALRLAGQPPAAARADAEAVLACLPPALLAALGGGRAQDWLRDPAGLDAAAQAAARRLRALPAETPSRRLLADQAARTLSGVADAVNGLALLVAGRGRSPVGLGRWRFQVADWLPSLINGGPRHRHHGRRAAVLDRDRLATGCGRDDLGGGDRHPVRAPRRPGLCRRARLHGRQCRGRLWRRGGVLRAAARAVGLRGLCHRPLALSGAGGGAAGRRLAPYDRDGHGRDLHTVPLADE